MKPEEFKLDDAPAELEIGDLSLLFANVEPWSSANYQVNEAKAIDDAIVFDFALLQEDPLSALRVPLAPSLLTSLLSHTFTRLLSKLIRCPYPSPSSKRFQMIRERRTSIPWTLPSTTATASAGTSERIACSSRPSRSLATLLPPTRAGKLSARTLESQISSSGVPLHCLFREVSPFCSDLSLDTEGFLVCPSCGRVYERAED